MRFVRAAREQDLPVGARLAVEVGGLQIALFNVGGRIFAIEDRCAHEFAPLHDGTLTGTRLSCSWHGWTYELDPARAGAPGCPRIGRYPVRVEGGEVLVGLGSGSGGEATSAGSSCQDSIQ